MSETRSAFRIARRVFMGTTAITTMAVVAIVAMPKSHQFAAPERFAMACAFLGVGLGGLGGVWTTFRCYRDAALLHAYEGATTAMRDTLNYILYERRLAWRWRMPLAAAAWSGLAGSILCRWPQLGEFASLGSAFHFVGGAALALLALQPVYVRANIVNGRYLKRYLRQQVRHIGFISAQKRRAALKKQLTSPKESQFEAAEITWELDDFYKNALVLGMPGSGKTMTVLNVLTERLLAAKADGLATAGVIFDPKGSLLDPRQGKDLITPLCKRLGRANDLLIFSPDTWATDGRSNRSIAWNKLDTDADALDLASEIVTAQRLSGGVVSQETFFSDSSRIVFRHAFVLLRAALYPEPVSFTDIYRLCTEDIDKAEIYTWLVEGLSDLYRDRSIPPEIESAIVYFGEWRRMPDRQRGGIISSVTQLVDDFSGPPISEMTSGASTMRIGDMIDQGKILYVHLPLAERSRLSPLLSGMIKLEYQREVLRRVGKARPSFMVADEFQSIWVTGQNHGDSDSFERSRESRHANIVAAQNISSFLKKTKNKDEITNFLGLCAVKVFLRNGELETNKAASDLFGDRSEVIVSMSESPKAAVGLVRNQTSYSRSTRSTRVVPPERFTRLAVPQRHDRKQQFAESIVYLGSRDTTAPLELNWPIHVLKP